MIWQTNSQLNMKVNLDTESVVQLPVMAFPGWRLWVDNKLHPFVTDYKGREGIIVTRVPAGNHQVRLEFGDTKLRTVSNYLSLLGFVVLVVLIIWRYTPKVWAAIFRHT